MKVEWFAEPFQLAQKQSDDVTSPEVWESDSEGDVRSSLMSPDSAAEKGSLLLLFNICLYAIIHLLLLSLYFQCFDAVVGDDLTGVFFHDLLEFRLSLPPPLSFLQQNSE